MESPETEELRKALKALEGVTPHMAFQIRTYREARNKFLLIQKEWGAANRHYSTLVEPSREKREQLDELWRKLSMACDQVQIIKDQLIKNLDADLENRS